MVRLAFAHPGKLGDALYSLPSIRYIYNYTGYIADFYTSSYCKPLKNLFEYQSCIGSVYFPDNYKIERMDMGIQPYYIPIDGKLYDTVWQLGFQQCPDRPLPEFIGRVAGINGSTRLQVKYEFPDIKVIDEPYIVIAPRGRTTYSDLFFSIIEKSPVKIVSIGGAGDYHFSPHPKVVDLSGLDLLETVSWLSKSKGFVGLMSAMLVLANGFDMPKVAPHDGKSWDMRHVVNSPSNFYPVNPTADEVLELMKL